MSTLLDIPKANASLFAGEGHESVADQFPAYLEHFAKHQMDEGGNPVCLKCKRSLQGSFRWGLANGSGACSGCGWPARAYHLFKDGTEKEIRIVMILQYHPEFVKTPKGNRK